MISSGTGPTSMVHRTSSAGSTEPADDPGSSSPPRDKHPPNCHPPPSASADKRNTQVPHHSHGKKLTTAMNLHYEYLASEHVSALLREAQEQRLGHQLARTRRLTRRADRLAARARLAADRLT
jgi:hypothetical protein